MSLIHVSCPDCDKTLGVRPSAAGKVVQCPACKSRIRIPADVAADEPEPQPVAPPSRKAPVRSRVEEAPPPPARKRRPADEEAEDVSPRPRRQSITVDVSALRLGGRDEDERDDEDEDRPRRKKKKKKGRGGDEGGDGIEYNPAMGFVWIAVGLGAVGFGLFSIFSPDVKKYYIGSIFAGAALIWHGFEHFRQR